jgi:hypothetical protein
MRRMIGAVALSLLLSGNGLKSKPKDKNEDEPKP